MNHINNQLNKILKHLLFAVLLLYSFHPVNAANEPNRVIVSGQVLHVIYGGPVADHLVNISFQTPGMERGVVYFKEVYTNDEGYFYDTIYTNIKSGKVLVSTLDKNNKPYEYESHFRFIDNIYSNILLNNFAIDAPYQFKPLQARFKYVQKAMGDRFRYRFFDQTNNSSIISRLWDFGDETTSSLESPEHIYSAPGLYQVSLKVTVQYYSHIFTNTITQLVYISPLESYHFGGHVFADEFPIDKGFAYLYAIDSANEFIAVDTAYFDTLGFYYFYQVPVGKYVVKSEPSMESVYYGEWIPMYYGDHMFWQEASPIVLFGTSWEYDINLHYTDEYTYGNGLIEGKIEYDNVPRGITPASPAVGANVYLMDENDRLIMTVKANESGLFEFGDMETKSYWVLPEITGVTAEKVQVDLSGDHPSDDGTHIVVYEDVASALFTQQSAINLVNFYPNPVCNQLVLELPSTEKSLDIVLYDMQGQEVMMRHLNHTFNKTVDLDVSDLKCGSYVLKVLGIHLSESHLIIIQR